MTQLWEIMVPCITNEGKPIKTRFHKVWDMKVYNITGGLTVLQPVKGKWVSPEGTIFAERMIPVRVACTEDQIHTIIDMTMRYYKQLAIMAYKISAEVIIKHLNK